jgi:hypothetical protein
MRRSGAPSRTVWVAANCVFSPRFADALRTHERDFDIRLYDVSRAGNVVVWRFRRRELIFSQDGGVLTWRGHDRNVGLPDMVVGKSVID